MKSLIFSTIFFSILGCSLNSYAQPDGGGPGGSPPQLIYVKKGATGLGNGTSWANAYPELQTALTAAASISGPKEIWVARGEYKPTDGLDRTISFGLPPGTFIYGGFVGTEMNKDERDWRINRTILSGDLGKLFDKSDNSYHVVKAVDTGDQSGLDGFTIKEGNANNYGSSYDGWGGGIVVVGAASHASIKVINCNLKDNYAHFGGGLAVTNDGSNANVEVVNSRVTNNAAHGGGGASINKVYNINGTCSATFVNCVFTLNDSESAGGGLDLVRSNVSLINCTIASNHSGAEGGGAHVFVATVEIINSIIWGNQKWIYGEYSQIWEAYSNMTVRDNIIQDGYGFPEDNNLDADPLFVREPSSLGKYPRTSIIPNVTTASFHENQLLFSGPKMPSVLSYYAFLDQEYDKLYHIGKRLQVIDFNQLTNGLPTSTIYGDIGYGRIQRFENSIHDVSNKIFFGTHYTGLVSVDRQTGAKTTVDVLAGEGVSYSAGWKAEDVVIDNVNDLLYSPIFYYTSTNYESHFFGLLELNLVNGTKRWINQTSSPISLPSINTSGDPGYWNGHRLYLDEQENRLYYSMGNGLWWWDRDDNTTGVFDINGGIPLQPGNPAIPSNLITHIFIDQGENKFYIGTHDGLFVWDRNDNTSRVFNKDNSLMIDNLVDHIDKNEEENLVYVACENGGLFVINTQTGEEKLFSDGSGSEIFPQLIDTKISSSYYDETDKKLYVSSWSPEGGIWIVDYGNLLPDYGDLRLQPGSPAIDSGDEPAFPTHITTDIDGLERFVDYVTLNGENKLDIGAYEREYIAADDQPATEASESPLTHNFILTYTSLEEISDESIIESAPVEQVNKSIQYFDGLGRPSQTIGIQASPNKHDIVQPVVYDEFSRESEKYLPYVSEGANGWFKSDAVGKESQNYLSSPQYWFYQSAEMVDHDQKPYAETRFEPSPLNRVIKQGASGAAWQPNPDNSYNSQDATIKMAYEANGPDEVLLWSYAPPATALPMGLVDAYEGSSPVYYDENQLYKNKTRDEHQNQVIEYVDKLGRTVLKKVQAPDSKWAQTYYIYDDFGNLVTVLPPQATDGLADDYFGEQSENQNAFLDRWAFRYAYDGRKRMTKKQVPGADSVIMVYDDRDRLVMTQDGNQRAENKWTFTKYDALNRPIITGIYVHSGPITQTDMSDNISATNFYDTYNGSTTFYGYSNNVFPTTNADSSPLKVLSVTYYDNYQFRDALAGAAYNYVPGDLTEQDDAFDRVLGLVTGTRINVLGTSDYLWSVNYYDDRYRVIQTVSQNHKEGMDRITNIYDFPGKVLATKTTHSVAGSPAMSIARTYKYDHAGRLTHTWHQVDSQPKILLSYNEYNELGQLVDKKLHSTQEDAADAMQQVDYRYNIRGWLTRINNSGLDETDDGGPDDYFGMELAYEQPFSGVTADAQFNGNISAMKWSTSLGLGQESGDFSRPKALAYGFAYDEMNRLNSAATHTLTGSTWAPSTAFHEDGIAYDLNGNIQDLHRTTNDKDQADNDSGDSDGEADEMDLLKYEYDGNQLVSVIELPGGDPEKGFIDGNITGPDYAYDDNGNMIEDKNKGIASIEYNHLNLPSKVTKQGTEGYIKYIYDATGRKLSQEVYDDNDVLQKKTDYLGEFIYEDNTLAFINHEEGRIIPDGNEYQYHLKDHLGNIRLTFTTKEETTEALATLETAYADEERAEFLYYDEAVKINSFLFDHTHTVIGGSGNVPVSGVQLPSTAITIMVGQTSEIHETVLPSNAAEKTVSWSSSDTNVATVSASGEVTGLSQGTSTITATTNDGGFEASYLLTVEPSNNMIQNPEFDQGLTGWTLYDYTPEKGITVSVVQDGGLSGTNSARVDITNANNVGWRIQFVKHLDFNFEVGRTYEISFVAKAESPRIIRTSITGGTSGATYWAPGDFNLTTTPQTFGPLQFTGTNANMDNEASFRFTFFMAYGVISDVWVDKVIIKDVTQGGNVTAVEVTPETLSLTSGQTRLLAAVVTPSNAANPNITWTSSDESVATVTTGGLITAGSPGIATITATSQDGGHTDASTVTVKPVGTNLVQNHEFDENLSGWTFRDWTSAGGNTAAVVQGAGFSGDNAVHVDIVSDDNSGWTINLNRDLDGAIEVGRTYEISFMAKAETPREIGVSINGNSNGAWWQQNVTLGTTAKLYGPYTYQCTNVGSDTRFTAMFTLARGVISDVWIDKLIINDVAEGPGVVSGVSIPPNLTLTNGQSKPLTATLMPSNAANQSVTWSSNNTAIATVDEAGIVTAHSPGAAVVTVYTEDGAHTARCILEVLPAGTVATQNEEFDDGLTGWVFYDWTGPGNSNGGNVLSVVQGAGLSGTNAAHVDVVNDNAAGWTLQLRQGLDFGLEVGRTYEISFMAKAESPRQITPVLNGSPSATEYWKVNTDLTSTPQTFTYQYTCTNATAANDEAFAIKFYLSKGVINDIWIDKVTVRDLSGGGSNPVMGARIEAESYAAQSGMYVSGGALNSCGTDDWARFENIDLTGVKELRTRMAAPYARGKMEVRLGSTSGTLIATMPGVSTGDWTVYKEFTVPVTETSGVQDIYIVFKDWASGVMNLDWIELLGETPEVPVTSVSITQESPQVQVGQTLRLTTTFTPADPAPTNQVVTWASDNTEVASINANGDVTGLEEGTATITVTTEDGTFTDQVTVTVVESGPGTYYSTRLSASPTEKYGLAKSLSVMPGDVVDIEVYAKYIDTDEQNWTPLLNNLIAALSIPSGGIFIDGGQPGSLGNETLPFTPLNNDTEPGVAPNAYLNYIIIDRDFNKVIDMGTKPVTTAAREYGQNGQHERLFFDDIVVRESGYMYIYISNESEYLVDVFFDDLKVTHTNSPIIQITDYYPFGLETSNNYVRENSVNQHYLYNGKEIQHELRLGWYDYGARMYDPALARWMAVDPAADIMKQYSTYAYSFDNPIRFIDRDGMIPEQVTDGPDPDLKEITSGKQVDMTNAPAKGRNAAGHPRNGPWFWKQLLKKHPEMFSADNAARIGRGQAPKINDQWIDFNPSHAAYKGDKLVHHHIDQGHMATGIPQRVHRKHFSGLHTNTGGKSKSSGMFGKTGMFLGLAGLAFDIFSDDPHSLNMQFSASNKENTLYYDARSGQYYEITARGTDKTGSQYATYSTYEGYRYNKEKKKYEGVNKTGTWTAIQVSSLAEAYHILGTNPNR